MKLSLGVLQVFLFQARCICLEYLLYIVLGFSPHPFAKWTKSIIHILARLPCPNLSSCPFDSLTHTYTTYTLALLLVLLNLQSKSWGETLLRNQSPGPFLCLENWNSGVQAYLLHFVDFFTQENIHLGFCIWLCFFRLTNCIIFMIAMHLF